MSVEFPTVISALDHNVRGPHRPLSESLERQLLRICATSGASIEALALVEREAPSSLDELLQATRGDAGATSGGSIRSEFGSTIGERIPVSGAHSARTIWSGPRVNWLFRAWHDSVHILLGAEFDIGGELAVARKQCAQIEGKPEKAILWFETAGQVMYHAAHGMYPTNQRAFVLDCVRHGEELTIARGLYHNVR